MSKLWDWVDQRFIIRRFMTVGTYLMTMHVVLWAMNFAVTSTRPGADIAMIIASVMTPLTPLMGYLFTAYNNGRAA